MNEEIQKLAKRGNYPANLVSASLQYGIIQSHWSERGSLPVSASYLTRMVETVESFIADEMVVKCLSRFFNYGMTIEEISTKYDNDTALVEKAIEKGLNTYSAWFCIYTSQDGKFGDININAQIEALAYLGVSKGLIGQLSTLGETISEVVSKPYEVYCVLLNHRGSNFIELLSRLGIYMVGKPICNELLRVNRALCEEFADEGVLSASVNRDGIAITTDDLETFNALGIKSSNLGSLKLYPETIATLNAVGITDLHTLMLYKGKFRDIAGFDWTCAKDLYTDLLAVIKYCEEVENWDFVN